MQSNLSYTLIIGGTLLLASCNLVAPGDIENPNVTEGGYLQGGNAMDTWVNGAEKTLALTVGDFCLQTEIISDSYFNNYTRESKLFDEPKILYNDPDVNGLERAVQQLRATADFAFDKVSKHDKNVTKAQLFKLHTIKAYGFLLGGENFMALPVSERGAVKTWQELLQLALQSLGESEKYAENDTLRSLVHTLKARTYYRLGKVDEALEESGKALKLCDNLLWQVQFDGSNNVFNAMQDDIWKALYQPLPRLNFLNPKYVQLTSTYESPISIAKAEENHLIMAEALLAKKETDKCKAQLKQLLGLVKSRPVRHDVKDWAKTRAVGGIKEYPDGAAYTVAASPGEPYRKGLVLSRKKPQVVSVPTVSGTSVTEEMIDRCQGHDALLELIYLMRQEIFIAEGRRMNDLGIRLPISEVEAKANPTAAPYIKAHIPAFIPLGQGMDAFELDKKNLRVTIQYNMNHLIVGNKTTADVVPFE